MVDIEEKIFEFLNNIELDITHDLGHIKRVTYNARKIAEKEGGNIEIITYSALLHDISKKDEVDGIIKDHALEGAHRAEEFLNKYNYKNSSDVAFCIASHKLKRTDILEANILIDADKLDLLGYTGLARILMNKKRTSLEEHLEYIKNKIFKIPESMNTETGKKIALEKIKIIEEYYNGIKDEIKNTYR
ncbi:HD domain-containing protein [Marinitoga aeolica]|uniref:HD domain-containing protein n=1 Tax=Marinitoga aeolica TaxID=2809031 RepID=A0ABY8PQF5_9BACT|nr:HD domain-containing protein [Marinitoga aeolica]WGS64826.1 HD domain-containing protein [Marinitoga aeolica]